MRLPDGKLTRLLAEHGSWVVATHVRPGEVVRSGQWLLTVHRTSGAHWDRSVSHFVGPKRAIVATVKNNRLFLVVGNYINAYDVFTGTLLFSTVYGGAYAHPTAITAGTPNELIVSYSNGRYGTSAVVRINPVTGGQL
ncbi:hypothetical protein ACFQ9X_35390 [Catenulispora yoronensis]